MWDVRYRPLRFADVLGQDGSVKVLKARLQKGTGLETSYVFSGGHGQGKTTLARIHARALLCETLREDGEPCNECDNCRGILEGNSEAFVEQDAASRGTAEDMRAIVDNLPFAVPGAKKRIYLFDEAHRMSKEAQDILLKPLEEKQLVGMFCTTEPEKIRGPIRSRCEDYPIRKVSRDLIASRMKWVLEQESVSFEEDAVLTVVDYSSGHVRDILNRLEMIAQMGPVTVQAVRDHLSLGVVTTYYEILLALGEPARSVLLVEQACDRVGADEVATGIAEAAMNAYRLAHGLYTDFALVDRQLAEQVHQLYGDRLVQLAHFFLQSYKPSRVSLVCDVARCAKGDPTTVQVLSAPPVVVAAVASQPVASASSVVAEVAPVQQAMAPAPVVEAPVASSKPSVSDKMRPDGIGALGTGDPLALTDYDHKVVRDQYPRGSRRVEEKKSKPEGGQPVALVNHVQWRQLFEDAWLGSRQNGNGA